tara:strand:- start:982 stop:1524 length:543 start_codon:yes stop_codon:yes gene_type:complete
MAASDKLTDTVPSVLTNLRDRIMTLEGRKTLPTEKWLNVFMTVESGMLVPYVAGVPFETYGIGFTNIVWQRELLCEGSSIEFTVRLPAGWFSNDLNWYLYYHQIAPQVYNDTTTLVLLDSGFENYDNANGNTFTMSADFSDNNMQGTYGRFEVKFYPVSSIPPSVNDLTSYNFSKIVFKP